MKLIAFDTETHLIQPGLTAPPPVCGSIASARAGTERILDKREALDALESLLSDARVILCGTNIAFDLAVCATERPSILAAIFGALDAARVFSVDLAEALHENAYGRLYLDHNGAPVGRYSLALLERRHLGEDRSAAKEDGWRFRYAELEALPISKWPQDAIDYPLQDARGTVLVAARQTEDGRKNLQCVAAETRAAFALRLSAQWGLRLCPTAVREIVTRVRAEHEKSRAEFLRHGLVRLQTVKKGEEPDEVPESLILSAIEAASPSDRAELERALKALRAGKKLRYATNTKALAARVSAAYGDLAPATETGRVSISADTLSDSGDAVLEAFAESSENEKLLSSFVPVLESGTEVAICPEPNSFVKSARTSYRNPNLQQLPRGGKIREAFKARPGWVFCSVDYSMLELCTLAQACVFLFGQSKLADAINQGADLHLALAAQFMRVDYATAARNKAAGDKKTLALRQAAKPFNFGVPGFMGPPKITLTARKQGVRFCQLANGRETCGRRVTESAGRTIPPTCLECLEVAGGLYSAYFETFPEVAIYLALAKKLADEGNRGRPLVSFGNGMQRLETSAAAAANHFFQNLAAQGAKQALYVFSRECYANPESVLYNNARPVVFVHDEIISELKEELAHECAIEQAAIMRREMGRFCPDVKISAEPALMVHWFKGAEKVEKDGRLVPWWPKEWRE